MLEWSQKQTFGFAFFIPSVLQTRVNIYGSHSHCLRSIKRDVGFDLAIYNYEILQIKMPAIQRLRAFLNALLVNPSRSDQGSVSLWLVDVSHFYNR